MNNRLFFFFSLWKGPWGKQNHKKSPPILNVSYDPYDLCVRHEMAVAAVCAAEKRVQCLSSPYSESLSSTQVKFFIILEELSSLRLSTASKFARDQWNISNLLCMGS